MTPSDSPTQHVVAIWNPASGGAPDESELRSALGSDASLVPTTEDDPGPGQARQAVDDGADILVACGGDGTVRACLDPIAGSDTALAIIPLGTGLSNSPLKWAVITSYIAFFTDAGLA